MLSRDRSFDARLKRFGALKMTVVCTIYVFCAVLEVMVVLFQLRAARTSSATWLFTFWAPTS